MSSYRSPTRKMPSDLSACLTPWRRESIINRRIQAELDEKERLSDSQFGFRQGRSTLMAIQEVIDEVERKGRTSGRRSRVCALILLDVQNALNSQSVE